MDKETSCINSRAILDYIKGYNNGGCSALLENLDPEIDSLPDPESFLRDPNDRYAESGAGQFYLNIIEYSPFLPDVIIVFSGG